MVRGKVGSIVSLGACVILFTTLMQASSIPNPNWLGINPGSRNLVVQRGQNGTNVSSRCTKAPHFAARQLSAARPRCYSGPL
jgi:hypothetical protein